MNRLKVFVYVLLVTAAGAASAWLGSRFFAERALRDVDRQLTAAAAAASGEASRALERAGREAAVPGAPPPAPVSAVETLGPGWLAALRSATGCDATWVRNGEAVGTTLAPAAAAQVARAAREPGRAFGAGKLGPQQPVLPPPLKLDLPLPLLFGEVSAQRGLAVALPDAPGVLLALSRPTAEDLRDAHAFGWLALLATAALFLIGLLFTLLVRGEAEGTHVPRELVAAAERIARGDWAARAPVLAGRLGSISAALNAAAEAAGHAPAVAATGAAPLSATALEELPVQRAAPLHVSAVDAGPEPFFPPDAVVPPPAEPAAPVVPAPPPSRAEPEPAHDPAPAAAAAAAGSTAEPEAEPAAASWHALQPAPAAAPQDGAWMEPPASPAPPGAAIKTSPDFFGITPDPVGGPADPDEAHWQATYQDFLRVRAECGESREGLGYARFREKLERNRAQLVQKLGCKTVRFQVYVKEGKAALKASPVR